MTKENEEKDIIVTAFPKSDIALAIGNTDAGREFMNKKYGTVEKVTVKSSDIGALFSEIKDKSLHFSFKASENDV